MTATLIGSLQFPALRMQHASLEGFLFLMNGKDLPFKVNTRAPADPVTWPTDVGATECGRRQRFSPTNIRDPWPGQKPTPTVVGAGGGVFAATGVYKYRYTFVNRQVVDSGGRFLETQPNDEDISATVAVATDRVDLDFGGQANRIVGLPKHNDRGDGQITDIAVYRTNAAGAFPTMALVGFLAVAPNGRPAGATWIFSDNGSKVLDFILEGLNTLKGAMPAGELILAWRQRLWVARGLGRGQGASFAPGTVDVLNASKVVTENGAVDWSAAMERQFFRVSGIGKKYRIDRVRLANEFLLAVGAKAELRLAEAYTETTAVAQSFYVIPDGSRTYFSEPRKPWDFPPINVVDAEPEDADEIVSQSLQFDRLVSKKRRKTYGYSFFSSPLIEGQVHSRIASDLGSFAPRGEVPFRGNLAGLSERGIVLYRGESVQVISDAIDPIFTDTAHVLYIKRGLDGIVNEAIGVHWPRRNQLLFAVPTSSSSAESGVSGCDLVICWDYVLDAFTFLTLAQQISSMELIEDENGKEVIVFGDIFGNSWAWDEGDTEGAGLPNATGTLAGVATAGGATSLTDANAIFYTGGTPALGLRGVFVEILLGTGVGQRRRITSNTGTVLTVTPAWTTNPSTNSIYLIGGFLPSFFTTKWMNLGDATMAKKAWMESLTYRVEGRGTNLQVDFLADFETLPNTTRNQFLNTPRGIMQQTINRNVFYYAALRIINSFPESPWAIRTVDLVAEGRPS